ncbi:hypothetical protein GDO81_022788 [Engystomops pustulosus]|uniref:Uncharacterized protein n=1 Tax=Engystomops pustulosus TaxID=76066 RepID=A0AAV6YRH9_ENGPU|nr:hypothetical protein GDO81_022788 [Engystomops pustulosus]
MTLFPFSEITCLFPKRELGSPSLTYCSPSHTCPSFPGPRFEIPFPCIAYPGNAINLFLFSSPTFVTRSG